jgi:hypothetical protein
MYRATVSLLTMCPSLASSFAIRRRLPRWVLPNHPHDELDHGRVEWWATGATRPTSPEADEAATVPADDRLGLHDDEGVRPPRPRAREHHPERAVDWPKAWTWRGTTPDRELLPEREVLRDEARAGTEGGEDRGRERGDQS